MGVGVMILGDSGAGKSYSLRNFNAEDIGIINVAEKPLPFKNKFSVINTHDYNKVIGAIIKANKPVVVVDDAGYLMQFENMERMRETGYNKYTEMANHFYQVLESVKQTDPNTVVYIMAHPQVENGKTSMKTIGKMLDEKLVIEGMFTTVLGAVKDDEGYHFITNTTEAGLPFKSSPGMFDTDKVDNDLRAVDERVRDFFDLAPLAPTTKSNSKPKDEKPVIIKGADDVD